MRVNDILYQLDVLFPQATCELVYHCPHELLIAVVLSAQTTDKAVNKVTPILFQTFPTIESLANASLEDIENCIKTIGLYRNKAKSVKGLANQLLNDFNGIVPKTRKQLMTLPGVGRKTANVVLSECYHIPAIAVDTHVERISKRLGLAKQQDDVLTVEKKLMRKIDRNLWSKAHHQFIFFGRYLCTAKSPKCQECTVSQYCKERRIGV